MSMRRHKRYVYAHGHSTPPHHPRGRSVYGRVIWLDRAPWKDYL